MLIEIVDSCSSRSAIKSRWHWNLIAAPLWMSVESIKENDENVPRAGVEAELTGSSPEGHVVVLGPDGLIHATD